MARHCEKPRDEAIPNRTNYHVIKSLGNAVRIS
jgi:hypothetical protein